MKFYLSRNNFKSTKINELDIELRSYMDECLRLRHLLEDTVKSKDPLTDPDQISKIEEQFQQQNEIIENLQRENQDMLQVIAQKDNETVEWRNLVEEYQRRINKLRPAAKDNKKLRKITKERKQELQKIRQELMLLRSKTSPEVKQKVDEMMRKQDDLAGKVGNNRAKISSLKKDKNKLQDQKTDLLNKIEELENERDQFNQEIEEESNLKKKFEELYSEEREKNLALRQHLDNMTHEEKKQIPRNQSSRPRSASKYGRKNDSHNDTNNEEKFADEQDKIGTQDDFGSNASAEKEILLSKINFDDIEAIAIELRETLKTRKISYREIEKIFNMEILTLNDLKEVLSDQYNIEETDALMTARYIFEQDDEDDDNKVMFNEDKQLEVNTVALRLQNFVRLNNTVDPYLLENEVQRNKVREDLPQESIEVEKESTPAGKGKYEEDEEIPDDYSDVVDDFEEESAKGDARMPTSNTPKIEEEAPDQMNYQDYESKVENEASESEIDEAEGLTIAQSVFQKMADLLKSNNTTIIEHFNDYILTQVAETEEGEEFEIIYIPPMGFLEGVQALGLELTETETKCLLVIMIKPEFDNVILVQDLCHVMDNFGIKENIDNITDSDRNGSEQKDKQKRECKCVELNI